MEELFAIKDVYSLYENHYVLVMFFIMIIIFYPLLFISKKLISTGVHKIAQFKGEKYEDIMDKYYLPSRVFHLFAAIYLTFWVDMFDKAAEISGAVVKAKDTIVTIYLIFAVTSFFLSIINISVELYKNNAMSKRVPIGLHAQILRITVVTCAILTSISLAMGISISSLFTSLGAAAALLTFVFKDSVLGLMASLQLTFQDIIKVGDWVTLPSYSADGDIEKITITVVVIRNFDKTFTTVPTYAFLNTGVKNWRAMFQAGGRRIKRSINLDIDTIKICDQKHLDKIKKLPQMKDLVKNESELFEAKNSVANVTLFRKYVDQYLRANDHIHKDGFTFLVRQLEPTEVGLPIELYIFTKDTRWAEHENIQSDIIDHLIGIMPEFQLKAFQTMIRH